MKSWPRPNLPALPGIGALPSIMDTASQEHLPVGADGQARLYVCGITPYDATHLGHAATYVAFDTLVRTWLDAGVRVGYVQNVTDLDDPLLERAAETGMDWQDLAGSQVDLFREDMTALRVIPPDSYVGVVETVGIVAAGVSRMLEQGSAYRVEADVYADLAADPAVGAVSHLSREQMSALFAERGGDPERAGKRDPLDPLLWRGQRRGEPSYPGGDLGDGRPGWHIECALIARDHLGVPFTVQGGGEDLIYPHHEMSTSHLRMLTGAPEPAEAFMHTALVSYQGEKMSKSLGNLVFVSRLLAQGVPPAAIRLVILDHHYAQEWAYADEQTEAAVTRLDAWRKAAATPPAAPREAEGDGEAHALLGRLREALADDLDTPAALAAVDDWAASGAGGGAGLVADAVDALLGVDLR